MTEDSSMLNTDDSDSSVEVDPITHNARRRH